MGVKSFIHAKIKPELTGVDIGFLKGEWEVAGRINGTSPQIAAFCQLGPTCY